MNGAPFLVTGPTALPVSLIEAKERLRLSEDYDDGDVEAMIASAVAFLDGYRGQLGRAIMPQVWAQEWEDGETSLALALPDASGIVVKADGVTVSDTLYSAKLTASGTVVQLDGVTGDVVRVEYTCGLPAGLLPVAKQAILLMVGQYYVEREGGQADRRAIDWHIDALRLVRV